MFDTLFRDWPNLFQGLAGTFVAVAATWLLATRSERRERRQRRADAARDLLEVAGGIESQAGLQWFSNLAESEIGELEDRVNKLAHHLNRERYAVSRRVEAACARYLHASVIWVGLASARRHVDAPGSVEAKSAPEVRKKEEAAVIYREWCSEQLTSLVEREQRRVYRTPFESAQPHLAESVRIVGGVVQESALGPVWAGVRDAVAVLFTEIGNAVHATGRSAGSVLATMFGRRRR